MSEKYIALVTGANRGIGFEVCRQLAAAGYRVILTGRDEQKAEAAAKQLGDAGSDVQPISLNMLDEPSVLAARDEIKDRYGRLDVLVNNAGGNFDSDHLASIVSMNYVRETIEMNLIGSWRVIQAMLPLLRQSSHLRIVNVSSGAGAFESDIAFGLQRMGRVAPAYAISKAALTALTVKLAAELKDTNILINAACPVWTATYPGAEQQGARAGLRRRCEYRLGGDSARWRPNRRPFSRR